MVKLLSGRPNATNKVLEEDGTFTYTWYLFMIQMWEKLGGSEDRLDNASPAGMISGFGGATAPTGWLFCDGSAVSRTTFQDLFDIIGVTYGVGDGSTTFNLPQLKGSVPVGLDGAISDFDALAKTGGEKEVTMTQAEMPAHTHTIPTNLSQAGGENRVLSDANSSANATRETLSKGDGDAHENMPPFLILNYIIKV